MTIDVDLVIRRVLSEHAKLVVDIGEVRDDDDLQRLGMSSHALVSVMLGLEDDLGVEFPDEMLDKATFASVATIRDAVVSLASRNG